MEVASSCQEKPIGIVLSCESDRKMIGIWGLEPDRFIKKLKKGNRAERIPFERLNFSGPIDHNVRLWRHPRRGVCETFNYFYLQIALRCHPVPKEDVDAMLGLGIKMSHEVLESALISGNSPVVVKKVIEAHERAGLPYGKGLVALTLWADGCEQARLLLQRPQLRVSNFDVRAARAVEAGDDLVNAIQDRLESQTSLDT